MWQDHTLFSRLGIGPTLDSYSTIVNKLMLIPDPKWGYSSPPSNIMY